MRVLIVEDEALVAFVIEDILIGAGHEVVGNVDSVADAVSIAAAQHPDLALVDVQLARGGSGLDAAAQLKALGVPCVFATANCPKEKGAGLAVGCLHKPFDDRNLSQALGVAEMILAGGHPTALPQSFHLL